MANTRYPVNTTDEAFEAILHERQYQDLRWNAENSSSEGQHSHEEWIVYIEAYLTEMKQKLAHSGDRATQEVICGQWRKVAAMAVACMEQNGVVDRDRSDFDAVLPEPLADEEIPF